MSIALHTLSITLATLLLASTRLFTFFVVNPVPYHHAIPTQIKWWLAVSLALLMSHNTVNADTVTTISALSMTRGLITEVFYGLILAFSLQVGFAAYHFAGSWLVMQMGLNSAPIFNPQTQTDNSPLSDLLLVLAVWIFFVMNGHLLMVRGLEYSFQVVPIYTSDFTEHVLINKLVLQFSEIFIFGIIIISPVIIGLILLEVVFAFVSRSMPQLNIYFVALPIKIIVGLLLLSLTFSNGTAIFEKCMQAMFSTLGQGLAHV